MEIFHNYEVRFLSKFALFGGGQNFTSNSVFLTPKSLVGLSVFVKMSFSGPPLGRGGVPKMTFWEFAGFWGSGKIFFSAKLQNFGPPFFGVGADIMGWGKKKLSRETFFSHAQKKKVRGACDENFFFLCVWKKNLSRKFFTLATGDRFFFFFCVIKKSFD